MRSLVRMFKDESGATAIEYGLIVALISVALIVVFQVISAELGIAYTNVGTALNTANQAGAAG